MAPIKPKNVIDKIIKSIHDYLNRDLVILSEATETNVTKYNQGSSIDGFSAISHLGFLWYAWEKPTGLMQSFTVNNDYGTATLETKDSKNKQKYFEFVSKKVLEYRKNAHPEGWGAVGNGVHDDAQALNLNLKSHITANLLAKTYLTGSTVNVGYGRQILGKSRRDGCFIHSWHDGVAVNMGDGAILEKIKIAKPEKINMGTKKEKDNEHFSFGLGILSGVASKWNILQDFWVSGFNIGIKLSNYYHNVENGIVHKNKTAGLIIGYDLRIMSASNEIEINGLIDQFQADYESKKDIYINALLLVSITTNTHQKWTIAGFNNVGEFQRKEIDDANDKLTKELNHGWTNIPRIIELAISHLTCKYKEVVKDEAGKKVTLIKEKSCPVRHAGAINIRGTHFRKNGIGILISGYTNQVWVYGCTFEFNRCHLQNNGGTLSVYGSYLADVPETVLINNGGKTSIDLGGFDAMVSGSTDYINNKDDAFVNYPLFCIKSQANGLTKISNGILGVNQQIRKNKHKEDEPYESIKGACFSADGMYELENVRLYIGNKSPFNGSIYTNELVNTQTIAYKYPIVNYVHNGLFYNKSAAVDSTYMDNSNLTISSDYKNPWGGAVLDVGQDGFQIAYTIPEHLINKKLLLMVMTADHTPDFESFGIQLDVVNNSNNVGTDLKLVENTTPFTKYEGYMSNNVYKTYVANKTPDGKLYAPVTRFEVVSTKSGGMINFFVNESNNVDKKIQVCAVILTEIVGDYLNGYPFGAFSQLEPKKL